MSALRVELFWDEEAGNWHYRVPALHINGGGTATREDAEREALSAISFALEGGPRGYDPSAEEGTPHVSGVPAPRIICCPLCTPCPLIGRPQSWRNSQRGWGVWQRR